MANMPDDVYLAYRINARLAGVVHDTKNAVIAPSVARERFTEIWGDILLAGKRRVFPPSVVKEFEERLRVAAMAALT